MTLYKLKDCALCKSAEIRLSQLGIYPDCIECTDLKNEKLCDQIEKLAKTEHYPILVIDSGSSIVYKTIDSEIPLKTVFYIKSNKLIKYPDISEFLKNIIEL